MKKIIVLALLLCVAALPGTVFANMAVNESFEDSASGTYPDAWAEWSAYVSYWGDGTTNYRDAEGIARTGDDCMAATGSDYAFSYQDHGESADDTGNVPVVVGQEYYLAAYFKDTGGSTGGVYLELEYRDGPRGSGTRFHLEQYYADVPDDGEWHLVEMSYVTPANTELITICVGAPGGGTYLYDDVWFDTTPFTGGASNPSPSHGATNVATTVVLEWDPPVGITPDAYDVYLSSTDPNADKAKDQVVSHDPCETYDPDPDLAYNTQYWWRVNTYDPCDPCVVEGAVWTFTTWPVSPVFTTDAESTTVEAGSSAQLYVETPRANTFQWYKDGTPDTQVNNGDDGGDVSVVSDGTSSTLTISNLEQADEGYYYCIATGNGSTESNHARLLTKRLMGHWKFNIPPANLLDDEVAGNNGTYTDPNVANPPPGSPTIGAGIDGQAISLGADELYVDIPNQEYFNFHAQGFTVSAWVKTEQSGWGAIVTKTDRKDPRTGWLLHHNGDTAVITLRSPSGGNDEVSYNGGVADNEWHMLVGTYDEQTGLLALYVDGEKQGEAGPFWNLTETDMPLKIGTELNSDYPEPEGNACIDYEGVIDDVRILSYAQDGYEIATAYTDFAGGSICVEPVPGDLNDDCVINTGDLVEVVLDWLECDLIPTSACN